MCVCECLCVSVSGKGSECVGVCVQMKLDQEGINLRHTLVYAFACVRACVLVHARACMCVSVHVCVCRLKSYN